MKSLQSGLGFEILGEGLAGLRTLAQGITFLNEIVNAHILIIRPLGLRPHKTQQRRGDDERKQRFHDLHINEVPCALATISGDDRMRHQFRLDMRFEFEFASPRLISTG